MTTTRSSRLMMITAMVIYGTIGLFRRMIPLDSSMIAMLRGITGGLFLLLVMLLRRQKPDLAAIKREKWKLILSGAVMGFNWILLFESYRFTSVAVSTLCYYMAPVFVTLAAPFLFRERLTPVRCLGIGLSLVGMVLVSGVTDAGLQASELKGVLLGLGAAVLYATVVLLNKSLGPVPAMDKTIVQLLSAGIVLLPYTLLAGAWPAAAPDGKSLALLAVVCILHTGLAYLLYFGSMDGLSAQTIALLGYIDPVVAVLLSALVLGEALTPAGILGAVLILLGTAAGELLPARGRRTE